MILYISLLDDRFVPLLARIPFDPLSVARWVPELLQPHLFLMPHIIPLDIVDEEGRWFILHMAGGEKENIPTVFVRVKR